MILRIFLGAVLTGDETALCVAVINNGNGYHRLPMITVTNPLLTEHKAVLLAMEKLVKGIDRDDIDITVYTNCEEIAFEWREEYRKDHVFCKSTEDQDLWRRLINYVEGKHIRFDIKGSESALTAFTQLEREAVEAYE